MIDTPVPNTGGPRVLDFTGVVVIGISGSGITSINGDGAVAQTLAAGPGITIIDGGGGAHTISATVPAAIQSINGDTTPAQLLTSGNGVTVTDVGNQHFFAFHKAGGVFVNGGFEDDGAGGINILTRPPLFLDTVGPASPFFPPGGTGALGIKLDFGVMRSVGGPPQSARLDGTITFEKITLNALAVNPAQNDDVSLVNLNGYESALLISETVGATTITGFVYPYTDNRSVRLLVYNTQPGTITFKNLTGSAPGNQIRIPTGADFDLAPGDIQEFIYTDNKWVPTNFPFALPAPTSGSGVNVLDDNTYYDIVSLACPADLSPGSYQFVGQVDFGHQTQTGSMEVQFIKGATMQGKNSCEAAIGLANMTRCAQVSALITVASGDTIKLQCMQQNSGATTYTTTADTQVKFFRLGV